MKLIQQDIINIFQDKNPVLPEIAKHLRFVSKEETEWLPRHIDAVIDHLKQHEDDRRKLSVEIKNLLRLDGLAQIIAESGISDKHSFWQELSSKFRHKILPKLKTENNFRFRLHRIFEFEQDVVWINAISSVQFQNFLSLIENPTEKDLATIQSSIHHSLILVSYRIVSLGTDKSLGLRFHDLSEHQTLFINMHRELLEYVDCLKNNQSKIREQKEILFKAINLCSAHLDTVIQAAETEGADINKTFQIKKCQNLIERQSQLIALFDKEENTRYTSIQNIASSVAQEEFSKSSLSGFMKDNMRVISLRISDHKSKTGEHYIARDLKDYNNFLFSAIGAGFIVSVLVFIKAWMHQAHLPLFWEAMAYSFNYALGFVLIQLFHFTLATKQPAMTAASVAKSLESKDGKINTKEFVLTLARISHTQTVSFIGNLFIVFPLPFIISWLLDVLMGYRLYDQQEAFDVINGQHPWRSGALWFAAITGCYLFLSGIIAGYVDNRVIYSRIPERIRQHGGLRKILGLKSLVKFSVFVENQAGSLAGNITLGLFLGTATFIGSIIGLPFDIRHITFAAGSFTSALYCTDYMLPVMDLIVVFFGILGIGMVNFAVSFGLAFYVACKSRGVQIRKNPELLGNLSYYFKKRSYDFFFAPEHTRTSEEIFGPETDDQTEKKQN